MPVIVDPEGIGLAALLEFASFDGKRVLEIGCGEGRRLSDSLSEPAMSLPSIL